jgi:hypothetical protein
MESGLRAGGISTGTFPNLKFFTKEGARGCPEMSVTNQPTLQSNPEERQSQPHCGESPKFPNNFIISDKKFVWSRIYSRDLVASSCIIIGNFL